MGAPGRSVTAPSTAGAGVRSDLMSHARKMAPSAGALHRPQHLYDRYQRHRLPSTDDLHLHSHLIPVHSGLQINTDGIMGWGQHDLVFVLVGEGGELGEVPPVCGSNFNQIRRWRRQHGLLNLLVLLFDATQRGRTMAAWTAGPPCRSLWRRALRGEDDNGSHTN